MADDGVERDPVEEVAAEFMGRWRDGDASSVEDYAARHPQLADTIRDLFPTIEALTDWDTDMSGTPDTFTATLNFTAVPARIAIP